MRRRLLLDTNVIVSGLFFPGRERKLLGLITGGTAILILPESVLIECLEIAKRKFAGESNVSDSLLGALVEGAEIMRLDQYSDGVADAKKMIRDEKDAPILAAALQSKPDFLISGDTDFLVLRGKFDFKIVSPKEFFDANPDF
ncbi:TPA: putative toxin-antitoxin system toxin component, PIN family [Candidatus Micrarchaeota archaeon]|nr:putative toxin-antitoxin system toxin component, PIN family [Candidatus Micrarchaeota archaeon]